MRVIRRRVVFFLFLLILAVSGFAQQPQLEFNTAKAFENFSNSKAISIVQDSIGYLWIGTEEGLLRFDGQSVFTYQHVENERNSLPSSKIDRLFVDRESSLWICTSKGLCKFNPEFDNFTPVITESNFNGASDLYISAISEDKTGQLYIANEKTIHKFDKAQNLFVKVTELKEGKINALAFDDQNSDELMYRYKLDGFDKNWIDAGDKREAGYTNLSPGKYTFRVKAKYKYGDWSDKEISIKLNIIPAWWMTGWLKILIALLVLTTLFAFVYIRIKGLRNQSENLEKIVAERTNEIRRKNELLKDLNSTKDKLFSIISHDLRSPFNSILGFQDLLTENYEEFTDSERKNMIGQLHTSTKHVYSLVENLLNWAKIQTSTIHHHPEHFKVKEEILEKLDLYREMAVAKGIHFELQLPDELVAFADMNMLEITLRNLVDNAIKFTPSGGSILIKASQMHDLIQISIIDSGTGMTQNQMDNLFDLEKTFTKSGTNGEKGSGLGLVLCKELVGKNQGTLTVESQVGKGSAFSFTLKTSSLN